MSIVPSFILSFGEFLTGSPAVHPHLGPPTEPAASFQSFNIFASFVNRQEPCFMIRRLSLPHNGKSNTVETGKRVEHHQP
jgi:hypothetical protein